MVAADYYESASDTPDYDGNADLVDSTRPVEESYNLLTSTRTYDPRFLPNYRDTVVDGEVVVSAAEKYSRAIPKVRAAVEQALTPDLTTDFSTRFIVQRGSALLWAHIIRRSNPPESGDIDPQSPGGVVPDPSDPSGSGSAKPDPLTPLPNAGNTSCRESLYLMPFLTSTYKDEQGGEHKRSSMFNPKTGEGGGYNVKGGKIHNDCLSMYKTVDNTGKWKEFLRRNDLSLPPVWVGSLHTYCGARETTSSSDCVAECVTEGEPAYFTGVKGPYYDNVKPVKMRVSMKGMERPHDVTRYAPTRITYYLCWEVAYATIMCVDSVQLSGTYSGFPWCTWYTWGLISLSYMYGKVKRRTGNKPDGTPELTEICIPYSIDLEYDANGCPHITSQGWKSPEKGSNSGSWDPPAGMDIYFELVPENQIPKDWLLDDNNGDESEQGELDIDEEFYPIVTKSSLQRYRNSNGR